VSKKAHPIRNDLPSSFERRAIQNVLLPDLTKFQTCYLFVADQQRAYVFREKLSATGNLLQQSRRISEYLIATGLAISKQPTFLFLQNWHLEGIRWKVALRKQKSRKCHNRFTFKSVQPVWTGESINNLTRKPISDPTFLPRPTEWKINFNFNLDQVETNRTSNSPFPLTSRTKESKLY